MRVARVGEDSQSIGKDQKELGGARTYRLGDRRRGGSVVVVVARYEPIRRNRYIGYLKKPMSSTLFIGHVSEILAGG